MTGKQESSGEFGKWLAEQIQRAGYTQKQTGHLLNISDAQVNRIVKNGRRPGLEVVDRAAHVFGADANYLRELAGYPTVDATTPARPLVLQGMRMLNKLSAQRLRLALKMLQAFVNDEDTPAR